VLEEIVVGEGASAELGAVIARLRSEGAADGVPVEPPPPPSAPVPVSPPAVASSPAAASGEARQAARAVAVSEIDFREAIRSALDEELERDERVILFGEDVAIAGGVFATTPGLYEKYGAARVFDTPISELAMTGAAYGAAVTGLRPVLEIMFGDFLALSMDSLINQATKYWFLTEERQSVPLVIRSVVGAGGRFGAIHSQMPISWLTGITGLKIVAPSTPADAKGLLKAAIRDENPVVFFEHKRLYTLKGPSDEGRPYELGRAAVVREGTDLTIVSAMKGVHDALEAADELSARGLSAEVVDLRTIRPLDVETIVRSVEKTHRVVVVEEGPLTGGWAGEVLALVTEHALGDLDDAWRITTANSPIPYSPPLEDAFLPGPSAIVRDITGRL
jgi:pyruvate/2-oxoglutarate/acetoin dehydrogenase E1 component